MNKFIHSFTKNESTILNFVFLTIIFLGYQILVLKTQIKILQDKLEIHNIEMIKLLDKLSTESTNLSVSETTPMVTENLSNNDYSSIVGIAYFCATIFIYLYFGIKPNTNGDGTTTLSTLSTNMSNTSISPSSIINDGGTLFVDSVNNNIVGITNISTLTISETANYKDVTLGITYHTLPQSGSSSFSSSLTALNGVVQNTPLTDTERQIAISKVRDQFTTIMNKELQQNGFPTLPTNTSIQSGQTNVNLLELEPVNDVITQGLVENSDVVSFASDIVNTSL